MFFFMNQDGQNGWGVLASTLKEYLSISCNISLLYMFSEFPSFHFHPRKIGEDDKMDPNLTCTYLSSWETWWTQHLGMIQYGPPSAIHSQVDWLMRSCIYKGFVDLRCCK